MPYKFEIYKDKKEEFRVRFRAPNGEKMFSSEGYSSKSSAKHGAKAVIEDATKEKKEKKVAKKAARKAEPKKAAPKKASPRKAAPKKPAPAAEASPMTPPPAPMKGLL
jgi:uncharacterized protein YegP (UPF0339 family)